MEKRGTQTNGPKDKKIDVFAQGIREMTDKLWVKKEEGSRHDRVKDGVDASTWGFEDYIKKNKEKLTVAASNSDL